MVREARFRRIMDLLGFQSDPQPRSAGPDAKEPSPSAEAQFELGAGHQRVLLSRRQARLVLFVRPALTEWIGGGEPVGADSDVRWSVVEKDGLDWLEVRAGESDVLLLAKATACEVVSSAADLQQFVGVRSSAGTDLLRSG